MTARPAWISAYEQGFAAGAAARAEGRAISPGTAPIGSALAAHVVPPTHLSGTALRIGWDLGRRYEVGRLPNAWTLLGSSLPPLFEIERRRRADLRAWRVYRRERAPTTAG